MKHNHSKKDIEENDPNPCFEKKDKRNQRKKNSGRQLPQPARRSQKIGSLGFTCVQCATPVSTDREQCGVNNRNHCPHCLYSLHVDLAKAGDRKAECKSRMKPVGLTIKQTLKRYGANLQGELMLIHRCTGCGKISINRIAADDEAYAVYRVFQQSETLAQEFKEALEGQGILLLGTREITTVYSRLFGWQSILEEFQPAEVKRIDPDPATVRTDSAEAT